MLIQTGGNYAVNICTRNKDAVACRFAVRLWLLQIKFNITVQRRDNVPITIYCIVYHNYIIFRAFYWHLSHGDVASLLTLRSITNREGDKSCSRRPVNTRSTWRLHKLSRTCYTSRDVNKFKHELIRRWSRLVSHHEFVCHSEHESPKCECE